MDNVLRTPEDRFVDLPGFPYAPKYVTLPSADNLRMHYVDEGPADAADVFLCLHGEPTWGYLYRRMLPVFLEAGHRVVAPDMFGFGRSDKPVDDAWYTFETHRNSLIAFIETMDLKNLVLVCQDWGGLLGLTIPMELPSRFKRLLVMNTTLGTGDVPLTQGFKDWRQWVAENPDMPVGKLMGRACKHLTPGECLAYDAPFPDVHYKAGVRRFPQLVPDHPDAPGAALSRQARDWWTHAWNGDSFMAVGATDPVLGPRVMEHLRQHIRGCPAAYEVAEGGHFVQEWGAKIAAKALATFGGY